MAGIAYEYRAATPEVSHSYLYPVILALSSDLPAGSKVLDLGCGNGSFISLFRDRNWKLYGSDFSPTGIDIARQNFAGIDFFLADASSPVGDIQERVGGVDAILCAEVIEHVYDPRGLVRNAFNLLEPGGTLIITTPYHGYLKNVMLSLTGQMDQHFTVLWDHGHIKFWSAKTLRTLLEEAGFEWVEFRGCGRLPWLWKSMAVKVRKPLNA